MKKQIKKSNFSIKFLENRIQIIDWLLKIKHSCKLMDETFFLSVAIFDKVLIKINNKNNDNIEQCDVFLLGLVSLFISCKFYEVNKLPVEDLLVKLSGKKYTKKQILNLEWSMLQILNFRMPHNAFLNYVDKKFSNFLQHEKLFEIMKVTYIFSLYNFNLANSYNEKKLIKIVIYSSIQMYNDRVPKEIIMSKLKINSKEIEDVLAKLNFVTFFYNYLQNFGDKAMYLIHFRTFEMKNLIIGI